MENALLDLIVAHDTPEHPKKLLEAIQEALEGGLTTVATKLASIARKRYQFTDLGHIAFDENLSMRVLDLLTSPTDVAKYRNGWSTCDTGWLVRWGFHHAVTFGEESELSKAMEFYVNSIVAGDGKHRWVAQSDVEELAQTRHRDERAVFHIDSYSTWSSERLEKEFRNVTKAVARSKPYYVIDALILRELTTELTRREVNSPTFKRANDDDDGEHKRKK